MNLSEMIALVRLDLKDNNNPYRWSDVDLERHIAHALSDFSSVFPLQEKTTVNTVSGSREIFLPGIPDLITLEAVEYPLDKSPPEFPAYHFYANTVILTDGDLPDGSAARIYFGKAHTLDATTSTIPVPYEELVASGAAAYSALAWAVFAVNRVNLGGNDTPEEFRAFANDRLEYFRNALKKLGRSRAMRLRRLYSI